MFSAAYKSKEKKKEKTKASEKGGPVTEKGGKDGAKEQDERSDEEKMIENFKATFCREVGVHYLGLWYALSSSIREKR